MPHTTGHGSYRRLGAGAYEVRWRDAGRQFRRRVEASESEILAFLSRLAAGRSRPALGLSPRLAWPDALAQYQERLAAKAVKPAYAADTLGLLNALAADLRELDALTAADLQAWLDSRATARRQAGRLGWARTTNKERAMLAPFFRRLARAGLLADPCLSLDPYPETRRLRHVPTAAEYAALWRACEPSVQDVLDWSLLTACRFGEVARARRADLRSGVWYIGGRKGRNDHAIALPGLLSEIALRQPACPDGLLFHRWVPARAGRLAAAGFLRGAALEVGWWDKVLRVRCARAGVARFSAHALRHAAATWAAQAGVPMRAVQALAGHARLATTELYAHPDVVTVSKVCQDVLVGLRASALQALGGQAHAPA